VGTVVDPHDEPSTNDIAQGFAIVDLETTGLRPTDSILQMAVVLQDFDGTITSQWSSYVRPRRVLTADLGPRHIHGITRRHVILAPTLRSAMRRLVSLTSNRVVVAHNAPFDTRFLRSAAELVGIPLPWTGVMCTLDLSRRLDPGRRRNHRLTTLCEDYGISLDHAHDALHDARATAELLPHLLRGNAISNFSEARPFYLE
jgi:DNA polymerase III subunit epsilon